MLLENQSTFSANKCPLYVTDTRLEERELYVNHKLPIS
nr:MAG TPA: hypothetical protein [Caudoviricetes sp.]